MSSKPKVFVITPFNEDLLALYEKLKRTFADEYDFNNAGDLDNQQNILRDIVEGIHAADVIIADLTGLNANVFYELGLAHAMNKKVIIITQDLSELPFDIKSYRANEYSLLFYKLPNLIDKLKELLAGAINGSIQYGNPVSDFIPHLPIAKPESSPQILDNPPCENIGESSEGENGFLDDIADIQENADKLTNELNHMTDELQDLNTAVEAANQDINRVKSKSGVTDISFVRSICRKLAIPTDKLANQIKMHNAEIANYWKIIENSYLSLLDNKYARTPDNLKGLRDSVSQLRNMQLSIKGSNEKIESFVAVLKTTMGIERKLNQAVTALITEFEAYLRQTDTMHSSIDRIISKSNLVTGN
ncbi:MAG: nucleoside 2-deoxyribosyltransferase [Clostridia bacterium]|nr:nucleoside 2-deoxyribosyltransferase [Clostridia bacterium]